MEKLISTRSCGCCLSTNDLIYVAIEPINLIALCFSVHVSNYHSSDKSVIMICKKCNEKIKDCYEFRCKILNSQTTLKKLHASTNSSSLKIELNNPEFEYEIPIKEELSSDIDDSINLEDSVTQNQKNTFEVSDTILKKEVLDIEIKQEIKSKPRVKKKSPMKKSKIIIKNRIIPKRDLSNVERHNGYNEPLPFKLDKEALACEICNEKFTGHRLLVSHMAVHYPNFVCDICGKPFVLKKYLLKHMKSHERENVSCTICKKVLKASSLRFHMKIHSEDNKRFACPHCAERFVSFDHRVRHMGKVHNIDIYKHQCKICPKKFHLSTTLSQHIRRYHFKELNVTCHVCGKGFYDVYALNHHMVKHTGEKKFQCDICPTSYIKKWSLILHMRTHTGNVIKHKCLQCSKEFTQRGSLRVHVKNVHEK